MDNPPQSPLTPPATPPLRIGRFPLPRWVAGPGEWVELFALSNLAFLAVDIFLAHAVNQFAHWAEWIPFYFSLIAPVLLLIAWALDGLPPRRRGLGWWLGIGIGWASVIVGVTGLLLHLE